MPYRDIRTGLPQFDRFGRIVEELSSGRIADSSTAHLDPDLNPESIERNWREVFGQSSSLQTHLDNNDVKSGDLFLFFGLLKAVKRTAQGMHRIGVVLSGYGNLSLRTRKRKPPIFGRRLCNLFGTTSVQFNRRNEKLGLELSNATSSICWIFVSLFDEAHNPKVVSSNLTPATN